MNPLPLTPLPTARLDEDSASWRMEREGFVDEAVVAKLIAIPRNSRVQASRDDLALAADDLDFAGWQLDSTPAAFVAPPVSSGFCETEEMPSMRAITARRAAPPTVSASGIIHSPFNKRRWFFTGLAGAFSTLILSLLLIGFSHKTVSEPKVPVASVRPAAPSEVAKKSPKESPAAPLAASARDSRR